jgi:hypothetical protein
MHIVIEQIIWRSEDHSGLFQRFTCHRTLGAFRSSHLSLGTLLRRHQGGGWCLDKAL